MRPRRAPRGVNSQREGLYFLLYSYGDQGDMLRNIKRWIKNTRAVPEWNGTVSKGVTPREGLKQGCCLYMSPILCAAFMNAFTADEPQRECHSESATALLLVCAKEPSRRASKARTGAFSQPSWRARLLASSSLTTPPCLLITSMVSKYTGML